MFENLGCHRLYTISPKLFPYQTSKFVFILLSLRGNLGPSGTEINSETDEPDSLETTKDVTSSIQSVTGTIRQKKGVGKITSSNTQSANESDLLALLQLERLAQQASRRDYELLRKQYQRYFFLYRDFFSRARPFNNSG